MPTYLYCLLGERVEPPPGLRGLGPSPVRLLTTLAEGERPLAAWVNDSSRAAAERSNDAARLHDGVCMAAVKLGATLLPARFGQIFDDDEECRRHLRERAAPILAALRRVSGAVEMVVTAPLRIHGDSSAPAEVATTGRDYLLRLREERRRRDEIARLSDDLRARVRTAVSALAREESARVSLTPRPHVAISHLIAREDEGPYRRALEPLAGGTEHPALVVTGPSAPYTFATLDRDAS